MMPGGSKEAYDIISDILKPVSAQTDSGACVTYVGPGGAGNFVKMVHNGIEYGDMQLISEAYDVLKMVGGLSNEELAEAFTDWNTAELESYLIEISSLILAKKDDQSGKSDDFLVDKILDKTGMKGTGKWTVQQAAELSVAAPTIASSPILDSLRFEGRTRRRGELLLQAQSRPGRGHGRSRQETTHQGCSLRPLRVQGDVLRARHELDSRQVERARLELEPRRDGSHLEGWLHHPRWFLRSHQERVRQRPEPRLSSRG